MTSSCSIYPQAQWTSPTRVAILKVFNGTLIIPFQRSVCSDVGSVPHPGVCTHLSPIFSSSMDRRSGGYDSTKQKKSPIRTPVSNWKSIVRSWSGERRLQDTKYLDLTDAFFADTLVSDIHPQIQCETLKSSYFGLRSTCEERQRRC